jgi:probable blue pigment (indigoidine) exporter
MNMEIDRSPLARLVLLTLLAPVAWGTTYVIVTETLPPNRPLFVAAMRVVPAGLLLVVVQAVRTGWRPRGSQWWRMGLLALVNFAVFFPLLIVAVYRLPGGVAAAAGGIQPLLVALLSWLMNRQRPKRRDIVIGLVAAFGVALVTTKPGAHLSVTGLLAAIAANVSFALGVVLTKRFPPPTDRLAATGWQLLLGGVVLVPLALIAEGSPPQIDARNVVGFAYLGLIGTALAFSLWFNGIRKLPTTTPPLLGLASPVTGALMGWLIRNQSLSQLQLAGFVVTIGSIAFGAARGSKNDRLSRNTLERVRSTQL